MARWTASGVNALTPSRTMSRTTGPDAVGAPAPAASATAAVDSEGAGVGAETAPPRRVSPAQPVADRISAKAVIPPRRRIVPLYRAGGRGQGTAVTCPWGLDLGDHAAHERQRRSAR